jgi:hypothetical protein
MLLQSCYRQVLQTVKVMSESKILAPGDSLSLNLKEREGLFPGSRQSSKALTFHRRCVQLCFQFHSMENKLYGFPQAIFLGPVTRFIHLKRGTQP